MMKVHDILDFLSARYPLDTACDFDNVGLLVGDINADADRALITLDCDLSAVEFAKSQGIPLIITHHPVIFGGLKSVLKGSVVHSLIENSISVISMHTNLDIAEDGVTAALCEKIALKNIGAYTATDGFTLRYGECDFASADIFAAHLKETLGGTVRYVDAQKPIKRVLVCSGSGGDFLTDAIQGGFDALVTADIKHNVFIDASNADISIFDAGHYNTENVILTPLQKLLSKQFANVSFTTYSPDKIKSI